MRNKLKFLHGKCYRISRVLLVLFHAKTWLHHWPDFSHQAMSQIFMYVIVPVSSVVAKETQILLLTRGELLMY